MHLLCLTANKVSEKKGSEEEKRGQLNSTDRKSQLVEIASEMIISCQMALTQHSKKQEQCYCQNN